MTAHARTSHVPHKRLSLDLRTRWSFDLRPDARKAHGIQCQHRIIGNFGITAGQIHIAGGNEQLGRNGLQNGRVEQGRKRSRCCCHPELVGRNDKGISNAQRGDEDQGRGAHAWLVGYVEISQQRIKECASSCSPWSVSGITSATSDWQLSLTSLIYGTGKGAHYYNILPVGGGERVFAKTTYRR